jgi:heptosyltransferase-2
VRTVIRAPNYLGDLVMALPALAAVGPLDVQVRRGLEPILGMARAGGMPVRRVLPQEGGAPGFLRAAQTLRRGGYRRGLLLTSSFGSALLFATGGVRERRGVTGDGRALLLTDPVPQEAVRRLPRVAAYLLLATGEVPDPLPAPQLHVPADARAAWAGLVPPAGITVGMLPACSASSRQWNADRFAEVVRRLTALDVRTVVFGGPGEEAVSARVAEAGAIDVGGRTPLPLLAAGLAACDLVVGNDTGPMHVAAAVGTPTVSVWGAGDPRVTGLIGPRHTVVRTRELPCVPCVKNSCPRSGPGYLLPDADRECLNLVTVEQVERVILARLRKRVTS